jgi:hypothetical protein
MSASAAYLSRSTPVTSNHILNQPSSVREIEAGRLHSEQLADQVRRLTARHQKISNTPPRRPAQKDKFSRVKPLAQGKDSTKTAFVGGYLGITAEAIASARERKPVGKRPSRFAKVTRTEALPCRSFMRTKSLPLPSSLPPHVLEHSVAQKLLDRTRQPSLPSRSQNAAIDQKNRQRSFSPLENLLKNCATVFVNPSSQANSGTVRETVMEEASQCLEYMDDVDTHFEIYDHADQDSEDVRRSWRVINEAVHHPRFVGRLDAGVVQNEMGTIQPFNEAIEEKYPMSSSLAWAQAVGRQGNEEANLVLKGLVDQERATEDDGLDCFWRPNILY